MTKEKTEFEKFDTIANRLLSVPRKELEKREKQYQRKRAKIKNKQER